MLLGPRPRRSSTARDRRRRRGGSCPAPCRRRTARGGRAASIPGSEAGDPDGQAELAELRTIKQALVPPPVPPRPGLEFATCHVAAVDGVAGDFHLVVACQRGKTAIFVGDVAGKGIAAARRGAFLRASFGTFAQYEDSPRRLLELANRALL